MFTLMRMKLFLVSLMVFWKARSAYALSGAVEGITFSKDAESFLTLAGTAVGILRVVGIIVVAGGLIWSAIEWMNGDGHSSKGLLIKTAVAAIIVLIAPAIINFFINYLLE